MQCNETLSWLLLGARRQRILLGLKQPLTATQISAKSGVRRDASSSVLGELLLYGLVECLNPTATRIRLYWLSKLGEECQRELRRRYALPRRRQNLPKLTPEQWETYCAVSTRQRSAVILTLGPSLTSAELPVLRPAEIKWRALRSSPEIRMSVNNVRDVIRFLLQNGVVERVFVRKQVHPHYRLSPLGVEILNLLKEARRFDNELRDLKISVRSHSASRRPSEP